MVFLFIFQYFLLDLFFFICFHSVLSFEATHVGKDGEFELVRTIGSGGNGCDNFGKHMQVFKIIKNRVAI